jgi:asparagine N-glycosylation enzyme membrane subunit Stt3
VIDVTISKIFVTLSSSRCLNFEKTLNPKIMSLLTVLIVLIGAGLLLWLVNNFIPMDRKIKTILNVVVVIVVIIWLLKAFGLLDSISNIQI